MSESNVSIEAYLDHRGLDWSLGRSLEEIGHPTSCTCGFLADLLATS